MARRSVNRNEAFVDYATRTALNISLTRPMILTLDLISRMHSDSQVRIDERIYDKTDVFSTSSQSLVRRGLVTHHPNPHKLGTAKHTAHVYWRITEAGRLVHQLCVMAELIEV